MSNIEIALEILKILGPAVVAAVQQWNELQSALLAAQASGSDLSNADLEAFRARAQLAIDTLAAAQAAPKAQTPTP